MSRLNKGYQHTKQALEAFNTAIDNFDLNTVPANVDERLHKASYEALISVRDELAEELDKYRIAMGPTDDQIIAEATRRRTARGQDGNILDRYVIEVMRENWNPHEPVDPDVLEFRVWGAAVVPSEAHRYLGGKYDAGFFAQAFLAGARMAAERERERAKVLLRGLESIVDADQDVIGDIAREALAKYEGGGE